MSELRISQMLDGQLTNSDPFVQARSMYDAKQAQSQPDDMMMLNSLFGGKQSEQQKLINPSQNAVAANPLENSLISTLNSEPKSAFETSDLPKILQKMGIDDKGLAMNQLGRIQLVSRLQSKFGNYQQNTQAMDALSAFDKAINKTPMDNRNEVNASVSTGNRTLKALLGGA